MALLLLQISVQRDAIEVLHDDIEMIVCLDHIQYFHDIRVVQHLQDSNFPSD